MEPSRKRVVILGSTGSVGSQALEVVKSHPDRFEVVALVAGADKDSLSAQADAFGVEHTGLGSDEAVRLASLERADLVLNAIVGAAGLRASIAALEAGKTLALANKESLVAGGEACLAAAKRGGGSIVPVDSEHAALAQCLEGRDRAHVSRLILTASGGPFRSREDVSDVTVEDALAHPTWSMGPKITIDCATLMNKGLEVIEAHYLFGFPYDRIQVAVHPQSVVHGAIELVDGSLVMQAGPTDMRIPILAALSSPDRVGPPMATLDLTQAGTLTFEAPDLDRFPALGLAYEAGREGRSFPAALNAANEEAVTAFLASKISFPSISRVASEVLAKHRPRDVTELDAVLEADVEARRHAIGCIERMAKTEMVRS